MAISILEKVNAEKAAKNVRSTAKKINKEVMKTSDVIVDEAIEAGEKWTKLMAKAMKSGTVLFGKQQDLVLDALEGIKAQSVSGTKRFGKLIGYKNIAKQIKEVTETVAETAKAKVAEARETIDEVVDKAVNSEILIKANNMTASITTPKTTARVAKKVTKKAVKKVTKKTPTKAIKKVIVKADDLKKIEGIGPKMAAILNKAGIVNFKQLGATKVATLKEILAAAGPRYKMHNPTSWGKQAKLAAVGRFAELKTLQAKLKGGKIVKK